MVTLCAGELCTAINARLNSLPFAYADGDTHHSLAIDGRDTIRFPVDAGGGVHGGSAAWVSKKHQAGEIHEPGLIASLLALAEHDRSLRTIFDIGALYGYVAFVARSLFPDAHVHAFEANPRSAAALRRNIRANRPTFGHSIRAHHCALSDTSQLNTPMRISRMAIGTERGREFNIDVWSLDDYCREHDLAPDLIKLDVEGYQAKIIPGAREVIARDRPVILMEFDGPGAVNNFGVTNRDVIRPILDDGYELVWGRHRHTDQSFTVLELDDLTDEHEVNSLGILLPQAP